MTMEVRHPTTPEFPNDLHHVPDEELHELPAGVTVPDDLSGLDTQHGGQAPTTRLVRWLPWVAIVAVLAIASLIVANVIRDDGTEPVAETATATLLVHDAITDALIANRAEVRGPNQDLAIDTWQTVNVPETATATLLVQDAITDALTANRVGDLPETATATLLVQDAITDALQEARNR